MSNEISASDFFAAKLAYETDPADLAQARSGVDPPVVIDVRSDAGWDQGHIPGAVHLPTATLAARIADVVPDLDQEVVVYCWGPGCNGSTKAAFLLAELGYTKVRELIGGFEYWAREGLAVESVHGRNRRSVDELTGPVSGSA